MLFVDFVASEQFGVIAEIAQEPAQLPQRFRAAIEPAGDDLSGESAGFKDGETQGVIGLLCMPAELGAVHPNQEDTVGNLVSGTAIGGVQAWDLAFHAAPSFCAEVAVELAEQGIAVFLGPVGQVL